jgi:hypothetical protein
MFLEVKKADYIKDYKLRLEFNEGTVMSVDLEHDLNGIVFEPLKNKEYFKAFSLKYNTIEWENGADFAPEYLFKIGVRL